MSVSIANGTTMASHGNPVTVNGATPPITLDQLLTLAESDRWN